MRISEIDFSRVPHAVIRKFFKTADIQSLEELVPVCYDEAKEPYFRHQKEFIFPYSIDAAWSKYVYLHPVRCWGSAMISFGMMYSKAQNKILYRDSEFDQIEEGQLYFIRLNIVGTILQIPVMHSIKKLDHENKVIQTCYLNKGKSEGSQWIKLYKIDNNTTKVVHETIYKGDSYIRQKYLYPYFHTKAIDQFHANIQRELSKDASILSTNS